MMIQHQANEISAPRVIETGSKILDYNTRVIIASKGDKLKDVRDLRSCWKILIAKLNILLGGNDQTLPTREEFEVMLNFAIENWSGVTLQEIEMAVHANISMKTTEFVKFYGKISAAFIQQCITNYQDVKNQAVLAYNRSNNSKPVLMIQESEEVVNQRLFEGLQEFVRLNNALPIIWNWDGVFLHMEANNIVQVSLKKKKTIHEQVVKEFQAKKAKEKMMAQSYKEVDMIELAYGQDRIITECRRRVIADYYGL